MKKHFLPAALAAAVILTASAARKNADDPVVMSINGKEILKSEFQYLYNKNNKQQVDSASLDKYVDMFVIYKLKVAEAEAEGLDKRESFIKEYDGYCKDISKPYMTDTLVTQRLVDESYDRMKTMRRVRHIMMPKGRTEAQHEANRQRLDSIRTAILNGADFEEMAARYSSDRGSAGNGGYVGWVSANRFPYPFEVATYATPLGGVSEVVEDGPYGFHLIRVDEEKPNPGRVQARHILKLTQNLEPEEAEVKKAQIDSIAALIADGKDFGILAVENSEDPGSAKNGGDLGVFSAGAMVPEFENVAFGLNDGQTSAPFRTAYGWHIVQTIRHLPMMTKEEARPSILRAMMRDERSQMPEQSYLSALQQKWGFSINDEGMKAVKEILTSAASSDEGFKLLKDSEIAVVNTPGAPITAGKVAADIPESVRENNLDPWGEFRSNADEALRTATIVMARERLADENPDYRNLINEYRDGILLFDISNAKVWDRASKDADALDAYFKDNKAKYTWDTPRYKGCVILATNDSILSEAKGWLAANTVDRDSLQSVMTRQFANNIKVERVLTAKGANAIVDEIAFEGPKANPVGRWTAWAPYDYRILTSPEEASDVKVAVSADLQQQLEDEWVAGLRKKYKVKINRKAIEALKKELGEN